MDINTLKQGDNLLYKYLRGSWCHGIAVPWKSDYDYSGVWLAPVNQLFGLRSTYCEQVSDKKSDEVYYELGRWFELLLKSNPTALESLFIDKEFIVGDVHPVIQKVIDNRDLFLTKETFKPFLAYAFTQIKKATGYNKKCNYPEDMARKTVLDFCYVPYKQGSKKVVDWLTYYGLKQKYCGLTLLPNMHDTYGLYYDWGSHIYWEYGADIVNNINVHEAWDKICEEMDNWTDEKTQSFGDSLFENVLTNPYETYFSQFKAIKPFGFIGIVSETSESNEVRVCPTPKDIKPLIYMTFNRTGYESHCKDYD